MPKRILKKILENDEYIYHVTEYKNLESILKNGLLSQRIIESEEIDVKYMTGEMSRILDKRLGSHEYVRLAYTLAYDMFSAKIHYNMLEDPVILLIEPEIILKDNTKFTLANGVLNGGKLYSADEIISKLEFEKIYAPKTWDNREENKNARQSEILIFNKIDVEFISEVIVEEYKDYDDLEEYGIKISESKVKEKLKEIG